MKLTKSMIEAVARIAEADALATKSKMQQALSEISVVKPDAPPRKRSLAETIAGVGVVAPTPKVEPVVEAVIEETEELDESKFGRSAGDIPEIDVEPKKKMFQKHRYGVSLSIPNHPMVTKRTERHQKFANITVSDKHHGESLVKGHYQALGYKVHDIWHTGIKEGEEFVAESVRGTPASDAEMASSSKKDEDSRMVSSGARDGSASQKPRRYNDAYQKILDARRRASTKSATSNMNEEHKVGDTVWPNAGVHRNAPHTIRDVHPDGDRVIISPNLIKGQRNRYRMGSAVAHRSELHPGNPYDKKTGIKGLDESSEVLDEAFADEKTAQAAMAVHQKKFPTAKHTVMKGAKSGMYHVVRHTSGGMHVLESEGLGEGYQGTPWPKNEHMDHVASLVHDPDHVLRDLPKHHQDKIRQYVANPSYKAINKKFGGDAGTHIDGVIHDDYHDWHKKTHGVSESVDFEGLGEEYKTKEQADKAMAGHDAKHPNAKHTVIQGRRTGAWHVVRHTSGGMHVVESEDLEESSTSDIAFNRLAKLHASEHEHGNGSTASYAKMRKIEDSVKQHFGDAKHKELIRRTEKHALAGGSGIALLSKAGRKVAGFKEEESLDEAAAGHAGIVKKALGFGGFYPDSVGKSKEGHVIVRKGFFYKHGQSHESHTAGVKAALNKAGLKHDIVDSGEHYAAFRGGASVANQSHFYTHVKLHEGDETEADFQAYMKERGSKPDERAKSARLVKSLLKPKSPKSSSPK
jgi:hypothetical protein